MSMIKTSALLALAASVSTVSAHGYVRGILAGGSYYTGYLVDPYAYQSDPPASVGWKQSATDLGYVAPDAYASGDIICHRDGTNAQLSATVAAGGTVQLDWTTWPESHHGPVIDYLANCNGDCTTVDKTTLEFFKIQESGLIDGTSAPGTWASDNLISNNNSWTVTIPSTIAAGKYVLRHEIIALHSAGNADGAQNYPQCINLEVTGGGSDAPAGTLGEALYKETDPGILVNIYTTGLSYTIPGPALFNGGSGTVATSAASGGATTAAAVATSSAVVSSAVPTTFATSARASTASSPAATSPSVEAAQPSSPAQDDGADDTCEE